MKDIVDILDKYHKTLVGVYEQIENSSDDEDEIEEEMSSQSKTSDTLEGYTLPTSSVGSHTTTTAVVVGQSTIGGISQIALSEYTVSSTESSESYDEENPPSPHASQGLETYSIRTSESTISHKKNGSRWQKEKRKHKHKNKRNKDGIIRQPTVDDIPQMRSEYSTPLTSVVDSPSSHFDKLDDANGSQDDGSSSGDQELGSKRSVKKR